MSLKKRKIFDVEFASASTASICDHIVQLCEKQKASSVIFANAHVVAESSEDLELKTQLQRADLLVPDGVPIAWLLQALGDKSAERYSGPDLMLDVFEKTKDKKHFFLGSTEETLNKIKAKFKGSAAGFYSPPFMAQFTEEEKRKQLDMILKSQADFIWVGLGAPKQEKYVVDMSQRENSKGVWLAVGAAFDFYAGNKPRAPRILQKMGMEWAYRLASDPKRLAGRYLKTNPIFISMAMKELLKPKNSSL